MADPGMFSQVLGLVSQGLSPQEAKAQIEQARIIEMAKMKPEERIYAGVAGATDRFAGGLGRLLGGGQEEDAMLRKASDFAAMRNQIDPTSADSLAKAAKQMYQMGFTTQGNMYAKAAQEALKQEAEIGAKKAETTLKGVQTTKAGQEIQEIVDKQAAKGARVQMLKDAGLGDSEAMGIASNDTAFSKYIETKKVPVPSDYAVQAQKLGYTAKPYLSDYTPDQVKKMEEGVVANKKAIAKAGAMNLDIGTIFDKARAAGDAKAQSEAWGKAGDTYKSQVALTGKLDRVVADLPATFTGSFANGSLQIAKVAAGLGIPVDTKRITNTEYLNSVTSELVRTIARDFPGSQSNAELQQLLLSKPSSPQQWQTILRLLQDVQRQTKAGTITYEKIAKLPQEERFKVDYNLENGQIQKKLARSDDLTARVRAGTASVDEAQELKKLRSELQ